MKSQKVFECISKFVASCILTYILLFKPNANYVFDMGYEPWSIESIFVSVFLLSILLYGWKQFINSLKELMNSINK